MTKILDVRFVTIEYMDISINSKTVYKLLHVLLSIQNIIDTKNRNAIFDDFLFFVYKPVDSVNVKAIKFSLCLEA